jgi:endonuclease IV
MKLGFHVNKNDKTMPEAIKRDVETSIKLNVKPSAIQIFVTGPRTPVDSLSELEYKGILVAKEKYNLDIVIHGAYVDNGWTSKCFKYIQHELDIAEKIGAQGVIIHLSKKTNECLDLLKTIKTKSRLILEINPAKLSDNTFESTKKLKTLFDKIALLELNYKIGLCVDTAHLSSIGVNLSTYDECRAWLNTLPDVWTMFHLNDSKSTPGSGVDRHEVLTKGVIWSNTKRPDGIDAILEYATARKQILILERDEINSDISILEKRLM